jgi:hypothetical protein
MVEAGKNRQRKVAAFEAARAAFEAAQAAAFEAYLAEARQAYLASYEPLERHVFRDEPFRHVFRGVTHFPLEMPQIQLLERQTNDHPINFQPPQPQCLVKNCMCSGTGAVAHLVKEVNGEVVPL